MTAADKAANNVIIIWKRWEGELNFTSTYVPAQLTKDKISFASYRESP